MDLDDGGSDNDDADHNSALHRDEDGFLMPTVPARRRRPIRQRSAPLPPQRSIPSSPDSDAGGDAADDEKEDVEPVAQGRGDGPRVRAASSPPPTGVVIASVDPNNLKRLAFDQRKESSLRTVGRLFVARCKAWWEGTVVMAGSGAGVYPSPPTPDILHPTRASPLLHHRRARTVGTCSGADFPAPAEP